MRALWLFAAGLAVYLGASYGGIRAADGEVVYRTAEALAETHGTAVEDSTPWKGFGLAAGTDGRAYSIFGPVQAFLAAPLVSAANALGRTEWWQAIGFDVPKSHYVDDGLTAYVRDEPVADVAPHAARFLVVLANAPIAALGLVLFYLLAARVSGSDDAGLLTAAVFGFGSLHLPYSGTFFSEPLATVFVVAAWLPLVRPNPGARALAISGALIGIAAATHVTAVLLVPFVAAYAALGRGGRSALGAGERAALVRRAGAFAVGLTPPLLLLALFDHARFGAWLETGRTVPGGWVYATWQAPWHGLAGLAWSLGKGALWYTPALVVAAFAWPRLARRDAALAWCAALAVAVRMTVIAARSDWHGGFGIGPRYLLLCGPLLLLPLACWVADALAAAGARRLWALGAFAALCTAEQIYFSVGEVFSFQHIRKWTGRSEGVDVFVGDRLYLDAEHAPLLHLLERRRGPFLLRDVPLSNGVLCALLAALGAAAMLLFWRRVLARRQSV